MTDRNNGGGFEGKYHSGNAFIIESRQVLNRSAAARYDNSVKTLFVNLWKYLKKAGDRFLSLHPDICCGKLYCRKFMGGVPYKIMIGVRTHGSDNAYLFGVFGDYLFMFFFKKALIFQLFDKFIKLLLQKPFTYCLDCRYPELVFAE